MMKKRNDEGFALAYVVVVIFILCSIAIALMSSTLRTLQAQENMVQRMKDKYEAMGEIERLVAELEADCEGFTEGGFESHSSAAEASIAGFVKCINNFTVPQDWNCKILEQDSEQFIFEEEKASPSGGTIITRYFEVQNKNSNYLISATLCLNLDSEYFDYTTQQNGMRPNPNYDTEYADWVTNSGIPGEEPEKEFPAYEYTLTNVTFDFTSYEVTHAEGGDSDA